MVQQEQEAGEKWRSFRWSGYAGEMCGSAAFGRRHDSQIVRLSSKVAREFWAQAFALSTNVTRLDLQVTVLPKNGPTQRLAQHHRQLRRKNRGVGRPAKFKVWYGPDGPEAAVLGKRVSDWFGRIYDKGLESGLAEYQGALRYEVELKRKVALVHANGLERSESEAQYCARVISAFVLKRALRIPTWVFDLEELTAVSGAIANCLSCTESPSESADARSSGSYASIGQGRTRKRLTWLHNAVRPSVHELLDQSQEVEVLSALGLCVVNGTIEKKDNETWSKFKKWR